MSQVEQLFYKLQAEMGGNLSWHDLAPMAQMQFVQAVNTIIQATEARK